MRESYLETRDHWPSVEAPEDLMSHFVAGQLFKFPQDEIRIFARHCLFNLLTEDSYFRLFWKNIRKVYPEKSEYFASLLNERMPYECTWIEKEYYRYRYKKKFSELSEVERKTLQAEFDSIRPKAYHAALKGEAIRLNCNISEVKPLCLVLPLVTNGNGQSKLIDLPDTVFLKIMNWLDTLDIFRVTLVCKRWKNIICSNPRDLKRAEHAKTTHLITFTEWMDPTRTPSQETFENNYQWFSLGLIRWCCGITEHLETLILDQPISYDDAADLLQSCPNLKNLQIGCDKIFLHTECDKIFSKDVVLPKLEFYCSRMHNLDDKMELDMKILLSCEFLRYFGASLVLWQGPQIKMRDHMKHVFGNLVALDLPLYSYDVLETLADVQHSHLRYLGLGNLSPSLFVVDDVAEAARLRALLERILPKLKTLEILKVNGVPGIGSSTIKLLTKLKLNLKLAVFSESEVHERSYNDDNLDEIDYWKAEVLGDFGHMLLSNNPTLDLSEFYFIVTEKEVPQDLRELNFGFTFISAEDCYEKEGCDIGLNFQSVKRQLGIDF